MISLTLKNRTTNIGNARRALPSLIVNILVFQNLFNAVSPYLTFLLNVIVLVAITSNRIKIPSPAVLTGIYVVLAWFMLVVIYRGNFDSLILMKYFRITLSATLLAIIFGSQSIDSKKLIGAINFSLGFHVLLIVTQILYPNVTNITAKLFGFDRNLAILEQYSQRKLGASSSYDTASLLSIVSVVFFSLQFFSNRKSILLIMIVISFIASLMSSRMGIGVVFFIATIILIHSYSKATVTWKYIIALGSLMFFALMYVYIFPIFLYSFGLTNLSAGDSNLIFASSDYGTTGTLDALTGDHLKPLDVPLSDLLIGFAVDPNNIGKYTDIGYVKFIYHIGVVGMLLIMAIYIYMGALANKYRLSSIQDAKSKLIATFLLSLILLTCIFNYKSLELYSRGVGDFIFIIFFFLCGHNFTSTRRSLTI